jgi:hypothetical protein
MVGIKGKGDIHQAWEDEIPELIKIGKQTYRLYATFAKKPEAEKSRKELINALKFFKRTEKVKVVPTRIRDFVVYCVYRERK